MVTLETLQVINADLDAERHDHFNIEEGSTGLWLKDVYKQDEGSADDEEKEAEEQEDNENFENLTDPEDTDHMKSLKKIIGYFNLIGTIFGISVKFRWNWKEPRFLFAITCLLSGWVFMLYTIYFHYANGDLVRVLEPMVYLGFLISCTQKIYSTVKHMESFMALILTFRTMSRRINKRSIRATVIQTGFLKTFTLMNIFTFGFIFTSSFLLIIPIKIYITEGVVIPLIPMEFIFLDVETTSGKMISNLIQLLFAFVSFFGSIMYGLSFITFVSFYCNGVDLLIEDLKDLDDMWSGKTKYYAAYSQAFIRNICIKRQDMNRYLNTIRMIYETKLFYYFCVNYVSQVLALYQIMINDWQPGYGLSSALFTEMIFYCLMGAKVSVSDDRLCYLIYDTNWYGYDLMSQKLMLILLSEAQASKELRLRFIGSLNMATFITIVKSIYTYYTVLSEML